MAVPFFGGLVFFPFAGLFDRAERRDDGASFFERGELLRAAAFFTSSGFVGVGMVSISKGFLFGALATGLLAADGCALVCILPSRP